MKIRFYKFDLAFLFSGLVAGGIFRLWSEEMLNPVWLVSCVVLYTLLAQVLHRKLVSSKVVNKYRLDFEARSLAIWCVGIWITTVVSDWLWPGHAEAGLERQLSAFFGLLVLLVLIFLVHHLMRRRTIKGIETTKIFK